MIVGHLLSFPSKLTDPPALSADENEPTFPKPPFSAYFIHEVTIDPSRRGLGLGKLLCNKALECARAELASIESDTSYVTLISVQGSAHFWHRMGGFLPYDIRHNRLLSRLPAKNEADGDDPVDGYGPQLYNEETAQQIEKKIKASYGPEAVLMMKPIRKASL